MEKGIKSIKSTAERLNKSLSQTSESMAKAYSSVDTAKARKQVNSLKQQFDNTSLAIEKSKAKIVEMQDAYNQIVDGSKTPTSVIKLEKELDKIDKEYTAIRTQVKAIENESGTLQGNFGILRGDEAVAAQSRLRYLGTQYDELGQKSETLYNRSEQLRAKLEQLRLHPELTAEAQALDNKIELEAQHLGNLTGKVENLGDKFEETGNDADTAFKKASTGAKRTAKSTLSAGKAMQHFGVRLKNIVLGALVFNVLSAGITTLRKQLGSMLKTNTEVNKSLADIKGNMLTAFQPIYEAALPALKSFLTVLKTVSGYLAEFTSLLFGKTVKSSAAAAEELYNQANASEAAADAAKDAIGSYDKLNVINKDTASVGTSTGTIKPTFDTDETSSGLIDNLVTTIKKGDWNKVGETIGDGIKYAIEHITNFIEDIDWEKVGQSIGDFICGIDWIGIAWDFAGLAGAILEAIAKALTGLAETAPIQTAIAALIITAGIALNNTGVSLKSIAVGMTLIMGSITWWASEDGDTDLKGKLVTTLGSSLGVGAGTWMLTHNLGLALKVSILTATFESGFSIGNSIAKLFDPEADGENKWIYEMDVPAEIKYLFEDTSMSELFGGIKLMAQEAWTVFTGPLKIGWGQLKQDISPAISTVIGFFDRGWTTTKGIYGNVGGFFKSQFNLAGSNISTVWGNVTGFFKSGWEKQKNVYGNVGSFFKTAFTGGANGIKNVFSSIPLFFTNLWTKIKTPFVNIGSKLGDAISGAFKSVVNGVLAKMEKIVNNTIKSINGATKFINKIPGVNIPKVAELTLPRLATGAVIPANKEFAAVLGDQKHGTNIEAPMETIKQGVREVLSEMGGADDRDIVINIDGKEIFRVVRKQNDDYKNRFGKPALA